MFLPQAHLQTPSPSADTTSAVDDTSRLHMDFCTPDPTARFSLVLSKRKTEGRKETLVPRSYLQKNHRTVCCREKIATCSHLLKLYPAGGGWEEARVGGSGRSIPVSSNTAGLHLRCHGGSQPLGSSFVATNLCSSATILLQDSGGKPHTTVNTRDS